MRTQTVNHHYPNKHREPVEAQALVKRSLRICTLLRNGRTSSSRTGKRPLLPLALCTPGSTCLVWVFLALRGGDRCSPLPPCYSRSSPSRV
ncbi:hypothetical protein BDV34DRAFT_198631 [Aspergillus parasiticus]|uniref:Uncharacterized protein n=1 Tax=Aspergillus parasiticus TaxID=5067 RepID=A0A5N6DGY2_ASPPA|nr:hypothetical protein BDV34DRAFT_198631 [Aspergillus parasiticus]